MRLRNLRDPMFSSRRHGQLVKAGATLFAALVVSTGCSTLDEASARHPRTHSHGSDETETARLSPLPPIRTTPTNTVPACVRPERLMAFLQVHNDHLSPVYEGIARAYKTQGERWHVRWDYAFYQMIVETNFLKYRRGDGSSGDVRPKQFNFAGIGTTGGGIPGDAYGDVVSGVEAHLQHLVVYSGEHIDSPIAPRTRLTQDGILEISQRLRRPVTFGDLAGRWAVDHRYGRSIEFIAGLYRAQFCSGAEPAVGPAEEAALTVPAPAPARRPVPAAAGTVAFDSAVSMRLGAPPPLPEPPAAAPPACRVMSATYGGTRTLLVETHVGGETRYTALGVFAGFEQSMGERFIHAQDKATGRLISSHESREAALAAAYQLCPKSD